MSNGTFDIGAGNERITLVDVDIPHRVKPKTNLTTLMLYRVFNDGDKSFDLEFGFLASATITVREKCSVDVVTQGSMKVQSGPAKGRYEFLGTLESKLYDWGPHAEQSRDETEGE